ncbi:MAG: PsbP-related protein [Chitinophagaceae bacterium]
MKWLLLFFVSFGLFQTSVAQKWNNFSNNAIAFTARYPANWTKKIKEGNVVFFTSPAENEEDEFYENVNIRMTEDAAFNSKMKMKSTMPAILEKLTSLLDDFTLITERYFKWNGGDAGEIIYTGKSQDNGAEVKITQWIGISKGRLFTATYTSLANNTVYLQDSRKILSSIRF